MHDAHDTDRRDALETRHAYYEPALARLRSDREREQLHDALEYLITQEEWLDAGERDLARVAQQELRTVTGTTRQELNQAEAAQVVDTLNALLQDRQREAGLLRERDQWKGMRYQLRRNVTSGTAIVLSAACLVFSFHVWRPRTGWWLIATAVIVLILWNAREPALRAWNQRRPVPEPSPEILRCDLNRYGPQTWA